MAIYHLRATMVSRSAGRSATAAAAYRSAERIEDQRTGLSFDYRSKGGVEHTEILAPDYASDWVKDRAALWNAVELAETRKNSQVAREIRVALPAELDAAQRLTLVSDFCRHAFVERGMVADIALHAPGRDGDDRNHHAHILLTTREIGPEGFTSKNRDWNAKDLLETWREAWARDSNAALERSGLEERIDHRTLAAQRDAALERAETAHERGDEALELQERVRAVALDRQPLPQLSAGAWQLKERGVDVGAVQVWREIKEQAAEVARVAERLAGQLRDWTLRAMERVAPSPARELGRAEGAQLKVRQGLTPELAAQMREAWAERQGRPKVVPARDAPEPEAREGLAARLREAAKGIDHGAFADRMAALRDERIAEEQQRARDIEKSKEIERVRERDLRQRDRGDDYGL